MPFLGVAAALLLLTGGYLWFLGGTNPAASQAIGGAFELTSASGQTVTDQSFRGRYMLIYFGYTHCRDVCPATLGAIGPALEALGARGSQVQPVFITVDPMRDTPAVMGRYVANFTPRLIGLTGSARAVEHVQREYLVETVVHAGAPEVIDHSSVLLLIGPDGSYLAPIRADQPGAGMALDIAAHMR